MPNDLNGPSADAESPRGGVWRRVAWLVRTAVGVVMLLVAIGVVQVARMVKPEPERQDIVEQAPLVRTTAVASRPLAREWTGYGTARAMASAEVSAQVEARVVERPASIEAGASVAAGDTIVRLEALDFENRLESAEQLAAATRAELDGWTIEDARLRDQLEVLQRELEIERRDLRRYTEALERGAGNVAEAERRQASVNRVEREFLALSERSEMMPSRRAAVAARLAQQEAQVRLSERALQRTTVTAPIAGALQSVEVELGELVSMGARIARVVDLSMIEVPVRAPVSASGSIAVGDRVTLTADGAASATWEGRVDRIAPEADAGTRTLTVFVAVEQDPGAGVGLLLPGQFVMARIISSTVVERLIAPRRAVDGDRVLVARARDDGVSARASAVRVRVAHPIEGSWPEIDPAETQWLVLERDSGLEAGDALIVSNLDALGDGALVRVGSVDAARVRAVADESVGEDDATARSGG